MSFSDLARYRKHNPRTLFTVTSLAFLLSVVWLIRLTHLTSSFSGSAGGNNNTLFDAGNNEAQSAENNITIPLKTDRTKDVYNRTLGFEKIFVISLPERSDRRDSIILSAALSNIDIEIVDAVRGENVLSKVIPHPEASRFMKAEIGCWRSHINIMQRIIQQNLSSILILEDDADWDVRIKEQLHNFALSTQALIQPRIPIFQEPVLHSREFQLPRKEHEIPFQTLPPTIPAEHSPYGDSWDQLWLGHCGTTHQFAGQSPQDLVVRLNDPTVPSKGFLSNNLVAHDLNEYPDHTRLVHRAVNGLCTQAYAITQSGARDLMMSVGVNQMTTIDFGLREWCDGTNGREGHVCFTTQPAVFQPHRKKGSQTGDSDIDTAAHGDGIRKIAMTEVIRWSTILNWNVLLKGGNDFADQYPDLN